MSSCKAKRIGTSLHYPPGLGAGPKRILSSLWATSERNAAGFQAEGLGATTNPVPTDNYAGLLYTSVSLNTERAVSFQDLLFIINRHRVCRTSLMALSNRPPWAVQVLPDAVVQSALLIRATLI